MFILNKSLTITYLINIIIYFFHNFLYLYLYIFINICKYINQTLVLEQWKNTYYFKISFDIFRAVDLKRKTNINNMTYHDIILNIVYNKYKRITSNDVINNNGC